MRKKFKKTIIFIAGVSFLILSGGFIKNIINTNTQEQIKKYLDDIRYVQLQIDAVYTDMHLYIRWLFDEKKQMKKASIKALKDLDEIKNYLLSLKMPFTLLKLRKIQLKIINSFKRLYKGIEKKSIQQINEGIIFLNSLIDEYKKERKKICVKINCGKFFPPKDFKSINEEIKLIKDKKDKDSYLEAVKLINNKKYKEAYQILKDLMKKYKEGAFKYCLMYRMGSCLIRSEEEGVLIKENNTSSLQYDLGLKLLSEVVNSKIYLPVFYDAFLEWRTNTQMFWYGMSNYSNIPNKMYNQKRWHIVKVIRKYLKIQPSDKWAQYQISLILEIKNIERGSVLGNTNLYYYNLYF